MSALFNAAPRDAGTNQLIVESGVSAPSFSRSGIPYTALGEIAIDLGSPVVGWHMGLPITANGRIAATEDPPTSIEDGCRPMSATGRLCVTDDPSLFVTHGVPFSAGASVACIGVNSDGVTIVSHPQPWYGDVGDPITFTVVATSGNASPLTYQWQENILGVWTNLSDGGELTGTASDTLTIAMAGISDEGREFRVVVTNDTNSRTSLSAIVAEVVSADTYFILSEIGDIMITETLEDSMIVEAAP